MIKSRPIVILGGLMVALLLGCVNTASPSLEPITPHAVAADAQPVVIDTDMAADDWLAILYLLGRSDVDVQAITRIIQTSPQKMHLIALGPLTNVGEVLEAEPG